jgi:hypothetical protein
MSQITTTAADRFTDEILECWPAEAFRATAEKGLSAADAAELRNASDAAGEDYATAEAEVLAFVRDHLAS